MREGQQQQKGELSTTPPTMPIEPPEGILSIANDTVNLSNDNKLSLVEANKEKRSTDVKSKQGAKRKDKRDRDKGEKRKEKESAATKTEGTSKCSEVATIVQPCNYSKILHITRSKQNLSKILLKDT